MKRLICILFALIMAASICTTAFASNAVSVDMNTTYQTIEGFGASYTWYCERLVDNNQAETGYDWIFNDTKFNILRFRDLYLVPNEAQTEYGYPAQYEDYYAYYSEAVERGIDPLVIVTNWGEYDRTLEWIEFVEDNGEGRSYYTLAKDADGEYMYDALAQYCVEAVNLFFEAGVPVDYYSITNEAELQEKREDENGNAREYAGFFLGPEEDDNNAAYWKAHIAVYEAFKEAYGEFAPELLGAETMAANPDLLKRYLDPLIENCPESLETVGHHLYGSSHEASNFARIYEAFPEYKHWQTEYYYDDYFGLAEIMVDEFANQNLNAFLYWSGVWCPNAGNCLVEVGGTDPNSEIRVCGNHYIMMHFSRFVERGYQRVDLTEELGSKFVAFKAPDDSQLIIIALNLTEAEETFMLDIGGKEILGSQVYQSIKAENRFRNEYMTDLGAYYDTWGVDLPAGSLTTVIIDLQANPDYAAPVVEKVVNPFVKTPAQAATANTSVVTIIIAAAAVLVIVAVVVTALTLTKKRKTK